MSYCPPSGAVPAIESPRARHGLRWYQRVAMVVSGVTLAALLIVAAVLTPNRNGMGTHRQLGLPPCSLVVLVGVRCPSCGMTTSWSHFMRGNLVGSVRANSGGTLFAIAALVSSPWLFISGLKGQWQLYRPDERVQLTIGLVIIAVTVVDWTLRLTLGF